MSRTSGRPAAPTVNTDRPDLLPAARDAEEMVIGSLLIDPTIQAECARIIAETDLQSPVYRAAWRAVARRIDAAEAVDFALVTMDIEASTEFDDMGAVSALLIRAIERTPYAGHAPYYARFVHEAAVRRGVISVATEAVQWAHDPAGDVPGMLAAVIRTFESLDERTAWQETGELDSVLEAIERGVGQRGWSTGIAAYDEWTPGLRPKEIHTIAGYTGSAKTWLACQMANALVDQGARVAFFSIEMPTDSLAKRLLANRAGAVAMRWGSPDALFSAQDLDRVIGARDVLLAASRSEQLRVYHEQTSLVQISAIVRKTGPDVVFVDYIQIMDDPSARMSEYEATTANARGLQKLAQKAGCTIVPLSQVNEQHQRSAGLDRSLGLKASGAIGAVSDFVLKLRPGLEPEEMGFVVLTADKNRHGPDINAGARAEYWLDKATGKLRSYEGDASLDRGRIRHTAMTPGVP